MNARSICLFSLMACALAAPVIGAQEEPAKPDNARFGDPTGIGRGIQGDIYGVVKQIGEKEIILDKTKFGVDTSIHLEAKTKYIRDKKPGTFAQLKVGDPVYVNVKTDKKTGAMTAKKVISGIIASP
jgi:hypothetical protein